MRVTGGIMRVVGCDPSLSGFAAATQVDGIGLLVQEWKSKPCGDSVGMRMQRYNRLVGQACDFIFDRDGSGIVVYVEGYSYGSKGSAALTLPEFRGVLYKSLVVGASVVEVSPSTLKMFAAEKGNADKIAVVSALTKRYGVSFSSDNTADAFALMKLGLCVEGIEEPQTQAQRKAVETVKKLRSVA